MFTKLLCTEFRKRFENSRPENSINMEIEAIGLFKKNTGETRRFSRKIVFNDEAHFRINRYVNKENSRVKGTNNPRVEIQSHLKRMTVGCGL